MYTRSGFKKPSETPVPKRRKHRSSSMPPKLEDGAAAPAERPSMMFSNAQFERLMKTFDAPSHRAAAAAEAAQAAANTMQEALTLLRDMQGQAQQVQGNAQQQGAAPARAPTGDRISKRMPVFCEHQPGVWFSVLEGHFLDAGVTEDAARYRILVALLSSKAVTQVKRILLAPPADAYARCKADLLAHFKRDPLDMLRELREVRDMGDRDAVEFLNYLRSLSPDHQDCPFIRLVFIDALPPAAKHAMVGIRDMDEMASKAQEILRLDPTTSTMSGSTAAATSSPAAISSPSISAISGSSRPRPSRSRSSGPQRSRERWRSPARRSDSPTPDLCALHYKYGGEAHKCLSPTVVTGRRCRAPGRETPKPGASRPRLFYQ